MFMTGRMLALMGSSAAVCAFLLPLPAAALATSAPAATAAAAVVNEFPDDPVAAATALVAAPHAPPHPEWPPHAVIHRCAL